MEIKIEHIGLVAAIILLVNLEDRQRRLLWKLRKQKGRHYS